MSEAILSRLDQAALAEAEDRPADARNAYAQAAALSRETSQPLLRALALRHLSDLDRRGGRPDQALGHSEQAVALYRRHTTGPSLDLADALRLTALALDDLARRPKATAVWTEAHDVYAALGDIAAVEVCDARLRPEDPA